MTAASSLLAGDVDIDVIRRVARTGPEQEDRLVELDRAEYRRLTLAAELLHPREKRASRVGELAARDPSIIAR
jgi:hypothetical protein